MDYTKHIIQEVRKIVSPVYLVGGSVRDMAMHQTPDDFDFTTPLSPDEVEASIKAAGRHVYNIGKKFGTLGFKVQDENGKFQKVEVTTFRTEKYAPGSRKPDVQFVEDLQEDLSRRDFTINAIAFDTDYIDPYGGRLDIVAKKIKSVGKAADRFKEDPLRMLRAARFGAKFAFTIDPNMVGVMRKMAPSIATISRERWVQELDKLLTSAHPEYGLDVLYNTTLLRYMLPEVQALYSVPNMMQRATARLVANTDKDTDVAWALFLLDIGVPVVASTNVQDESYATFPHEAIIGFELARGIALRLKFSNDRQKVIEDAFKNKNKWEQKYGQTKVQVK